MDDPLRRPSVLTGVIGMVLAVAIGVAGAMVGSTLLLALSGPLALFSVIPIWIGLGTGPGPTD